MLSLPVFWSRPIVDTILLPAHAQSSPIDVPPTDPEPPVPPATCVGNPLRQTNVIPDQAANYVETMTFDQYPDSGLLSVSITWEVNVTGIVRLENLEAPTGNPAIDITRIGVTVSAETALMEVLGSELVRVTPQVTQEDDVDAHDGIVDFAGASGRTFNGVIASESGSVVLTDPADLARYQGSGTLDFQIASNATSRAFGTANLVANIQTNSSVAVQITYRCE